MEGLICEMILSDLLIDKQRRASNLKKKEMLQRTGLRCFTRRTSMLLENEAWREHITYVKYLNVCTLSLHKCVKDSKSAKYTRNSIASYHTQEPDGQGAHVKIVKVPDSVENY
eukprot:PhM_4_TR738/c0_g1_i1/m.100038